MSLGQIRKNQGESPERSGLEAEGEMTGSGRRARSYTARADRVGPLDRCPMTATTWLLSANRLATRTAMSSTPLSSTNTSRRGRPPMPPRSRSCCSASWAAALIDAPRG